LCAGAGGAGGAAGAPVVAGAGAGAAGAAASFLTGSGAFFSGADGQPITATMKRIDKMIAISFLIDSYLLLSKVSDVGGSTRS